MPKPEPLVLKGVIPDKDAAIKFGGGKQDSATLTFDVYSEDLEAYKRLLGMRGNQLFIVISEVPEDGTT